MQFWKTIYGLVRRKHIGLPVIILSLALAGVAYLLTPARYISTASMVLTSPPAGGTLTNDPEKQTGLTNPLLQFSDGLRTTAHILILSMNTPEVLAELGIKEGGPTEIVVDDGRTNPELLGLSMTGPFIYVEVDSEFATVAKDVTNRAQRRIRQELNKRQEALGAPLSTYVSVVDVVPPSAPEASLGGKFEMAGGALFLGVVGGLGIAYAVQRAKANRRRPVSGPDLPGGPASRPLPAPVRHAEPAKDVKRGLERAEPLKRPAVIPAARNGDLRSADSHGASLVVTFPVAGDSGEDTDEDTVVFRAIRPDDDATGPIPAIRDDRRDASGPPGGALGDRPKDRPDDRPKDRPKERLGDRPGDRPGGEQDSRPGGERGENESAE
jgi:hypothetical protein